MSLLEPKKSHCLNCGEALQGAFCHVCGQKNKDLELSFWKLLKNFIDELTFFDNKIFSTLKLIAYHPAKLTELYISGQRVRFVPPFRLYLFLSSLFFVFAISNVKNTFIKSNNQQRIEIESALAKEVGNDSLAKALLEKQRDSFLIESKLKENDSWLVKKLKTKTHYLDSKYRDKSEDFINDIASAFAENLPYFLYLSLPMVAFSLWIFYRKKRNAFYVNHFIFTLNLFSSIFFYLILLDLAEFIYSAITHVELVTNGYVVLFIEVFSFLALKLFYRQSLFKTLLKFMLLNFILGVFMGILMLLFLIFSVFSL